ncbi:rRNA biogenesis protein rrp36 [Thoreauomyces humboldtii]|nr:rRNA biogenesis protein rrp36 [Thoreauomyces humboldtii]
MERVMRRMQAFDGGPSDDDDDDRAESEEDVIDDDDEDEQPSHRPARAFTQDDDEESDDGEQGSSDDQDASDSDRSQGSDDGSDDDQDAPVQTSAEIARMRRELAIVPFDQLMEIQQKVGMKEFHANYRGLDRSAIPEDELIAPEEDQAGFGTGKRRPQFDSEKGGKLVRPPKRKDKNMPVEVTSKRAVTRKRDVVELPKNKTRDPRFDPLAGKLNEGLFATSYGFLRDYEASEMEMLRKQIVTEKDEEVKEVLKQTLTSMSSRAQARKLKDKRTQLVKEWKQKEKALVAEGKKPWQLKQSDIKKMELVDRYKSMKGKDIDKLLEKRRKKNATKERKFLPYKRRSADAPAS